MSNGQYIGHANQATSAIRPARKIRNEKVKKTFKQKLRNWLFDEDGPDVLASSLTISEDRLQSDGIRLQVYKASGGFVVETRGYDRKTDRSHNTMHVVTEEEDLGNRLSKIIMMEAMR
jgi:hypothetical protein